jgi:hypothetical protein
MLKCFIVIQILNALSITQANGIFFYILTANGLYSFIYSLLLGTLKHIVCVSMCGSKGRNVM